MPLSGGYSLIVNPRRRLSLVFQHNPPLFRAFFFMSISSCKNKCMEMHL